MIFSFSEVNLRMMYSLTMLCSSTTTTTLLIHVILLNFLVGNTTPLRLTNMTAPAIQDPRDDMQLHCRFDMGGEELYAVKWYKDDHEFFRYSPSSKNVTTQYHVEGVQVESSRTECTRSGCDLLLTNLSRPLSSGAYRCEVSSEAPAFRLASQTHNVTVAALPRSHPTFSNLRGSYTIGDVILANCESDWGDPEPIITWKVNKKTVSSKIIRDLPSEEAFPDQHDTRVKLKKAHSQMRLILDKNYTNNRPSSSLEVTCVSSVEGLNPSVAPPLSSTKTIMLLDKNQLVSNEKLHSVAVASLAQRLNYLQIVIVLLMLRVLNVIRC